MSKCYRNGGCGPYENRACNECPASKPEYLNRYKKNNEEILVVATIEGENKDGYIAIGNTELEAKKNLLRAFYNEDDHTEEELKEDGCHIVTHTFKNGNKALIF